MKTLLTATPLLLLCIFSFTNSPAQIPGLQWGKNIGGSRADDIIVDAAGNVYTTGYFSGVKDFDPGPATFYMSAAGGGADDAYVSKLDVNGNFVWAKQLGGNATNYGKALAVDAAGNVYSAGWFSGTVDFDPGIAVNNLTAVAQSDIYVSKLDASGNFIWVKQIGSNQAEIPYSIVLDETGNMILTGTFDGQLDFDPGPGVFNLNGNGNNDCFILKLDAAGNFVWAKQVAGNYSQGDAISTDAAGNLYVCGNYNFTADLDPGPGVYNVTAAGGADVFMIKLNAAGNFIWGRSVGSIGTDVAESIKADANGNVYVTGNFPFTVDFDPGPGTYNVTVVGSTDIYLLKLDVNGNFAWAKIFAGPNAEAGHDVVIDATGNIYVTGLFLSTVDFDPGPGVYNLASFVASTDIFIVKLNAAGDFVYAIRLGGATLDGGLALFVNDAGILHATGYFDGAEDFDPGPGTTILNSANGATFIIKLGEGLVPLSLADFSGTPSLNGNLLQWQTTQEINTKDFIIEWSSDGNHFETIGVMPAAGHSAAVVNYHFTHASPPAGYNYYRLKMQDINGAFIYSPFVIIHNKENAITAKIFPQPVSTILNIELPSTKDQSIVLNLLGADGKIIDTKKQFLQKGKNLFRWNLLPFAPGNYYIASPAGYFKTIKIVKQ